MPLIPINNEKPPLKVRHVCWFTQPNGDEINLNELVECFYDHPDAQGHAMFPVYEVWHRQTLLRSEWRASSSVILESAQTTIAHLFPPSNIDNTGR